MTRPSLGVLFLMGTLKLSAQTPALQPTYDFSLSREQKINLAKSAAPPEVSNNATVYALERTGYVKVQDGTNGFSCFVDRQTPLNQEPTCFDAEGSSSTLQSRFFAEEQRGKGKSEDDIKAAIARDIRAASFTLPPSPGLST
jgi:hypothetical protein